MAKIVKNTIPSIPFFGILNDIKIFGGIFQNMLNNMINYLHISKQSRTFAPFFGRNKYLTFICAVFFIAISLGYHSNGYCAEKSVIVPSRTEKGSLSSFNTLSFSSFMEGTTKNASNQKNSKITSTPHSAKTVPITFTLTGVRNNPYLYSIRKAFFEFIEEEMCGHIFSESRFVKKYEAANTLFPEFRRALRGKTILIK